MNTIAAVCGPGRTMYLTEEVTVGDVLHVDGGAPDRLYVMWVGPGPGPYEVALGDPSRYAGMGWLGRRLLPGESVRVVSRRDTGRPVPDGLLETVAGVLQRHVDAELLVLPQQSPFRDRPTVMQVSPGCREASFGWVHVKPSCRCSQ